MVAEDLAAEPKEEGKFDGEFAESQGPQSERSQCEDVASSLPADVPNVSNEALGSCGGIVVSQGVKM